MGVFPPCSTCGTFYGTDLCSACGSLFGHMFNIRHPVTALWLMWSLTCK